MADVKSFEINGTELMIKDEYARQQLDNIASQITNGNIGNNVEPQLMDMPRIYLSEGTLPTSKTSTTMKFDYYSKTKEEHGYVDIKCQGNSSMAYNKKNFTIKTYSDKEKTTKKKIDFKGWGKQSKFVLKANWIDITHARNIVSARIWSDIVKSRNGYDNLPELFRTSPNQGAVDGFPVLVYSNGVYQGRYTLNIPKDKWMSNMDDSLDTHCILCGENYVSGCFRATANINGTDWTDELHDIVPNSIKTRWNECISFVMNSTDEEFKANLNNYFDVESVIDYLLFGIISCGLDAFGKNQLYFTYDGQKWIASMYDMDSTWGLWWNGSKFVATDYPRESFEDYNGSGREGNFLYIRLQKLFVDELKARYTELRKDVLSASHIIQRFEEFIQICANDVVKEDYASTTGEGKFTGMPSTATNNIQQLRSYIVARLTYCDTYIDSLVESVACTGITLNANAIVFEMTTDSQTLVATVEPSDTTDTVVWTVDDNTIATVENGVVTPLKNGSCVITATCGTQSVSCNVTVNISEIGQDLSVKSLSLDKNLINLSSSGEPINLLNGVNCTEQTDGNIIFDSITLDAGVYEYKNIGDGTFTWLGINQNNNGKYEMGNNTNSLKFIITSGTVSCVFNAFKNNIDTNTVDKLGLYKVENITLTDNVLDFTRVGEGYFIEGNVNTIHESTNDSYGYVEVDSTKKYAIKLSVDSYLKEDFSFAGIKGNNTSGNYIGSLTNANSNFYIKQSTSVLYFEDVDKIYWCGKNVLGIENAHVIEVEITPNTETQIKLSDTLTATLTPSNAENQNVTWESNNTSVATVESNGLSATVNGVSNGSAIITCISEDTTNGIISDTCNVTVSGISESG